MRTTPLRQADILGKAPTGNPVEVLARSIRAAKSPINRQQMRDHVRTLPRKHRLFLGFGLVHRGVLP